MRQDFTDQTVLKMPKIVYANLVYLEMSCQMGAYGFDTLSDTFAKSKKRLRQRSFHILPWRSDDKNIMTLQ